MKNTIVVWLILWLIICAFNNKPTHDFHSAIAEIDYNPKSKSFEIAARFFIDDLEKKISLTTNRKIRLDTEKHADSLLSVFMNQNLKLFVSNKLYANKWHGYQIKDQTIWLYTQIYLPNYISGLSLEFNALTDVFSDQTNIAHISINENKRSMLFTKNAKRQDF